MKLKSIGRVKNLSDSESALELEGTCTAGLEGLHPGMKIQVLYWMHELTPRDRMILKAHPKGDASRPERGVFALRSPMRPNPIGVSTVEVVRMDGSKVVVKDLDARDHSPLIDIKVFTGP